MQKQSHRSSEAVEKLLAAAPASSSMRYDASPQGQLDQRLDTWISRTDECRQHGVWRSVRPGSIAGQYRASTQKWATDSCHERGCPQCGRDKATRDLKRHSDRLAEVTCEGVVVVMRLEPPSGTSPDDAREAIDRWKRRKAVVDHIQPMVGTYHAEAGEVVNYGVSWITTLSDAITILGQEWVEATGGNYEVLPVDPDPFFTLVVRSALTSTLSGVVPGRAEPRCPLNQRCQRECTAATRGIEVPPHITAHIERFQATRIAYLRRLRLPVMYGSFAI